MAEWGWTHDYIERELTDELLVRYMDALVDRVEQRARTEVENVRIGTILAHDKKAYARWVQKAKQGPSLVGDALESAVMGIARMFPQNVSRGTL